MIIFNYLCTAKMNCMLRFCWVISLVMIILAAPSVEAQNHKRSYEGPGNWFFGLNLGTSLAMNENVKSDNFFHTEIPSGSIQLGRTFTPWFNLRVVGLLSSQMGYPSDISVAYRQQMFNPYRFYAAISTMDMMLNLTNCFRRYDTRNWFDAYLVFGGGGLFRFNVDEKVRYWYIDVYPVEANNYWFWTAKAGFEGAWHVSRGWDLTLEVDMFASDNAYNGVVGTTRSWDPFLVMQLGMTYYFRNSRHRHRYANPPVVHKYWTELNNF